MAIADEVDSQLAQAMTCYISEAQVDALTLEPKRFGIVAAFGEDRA
jgi:hypothetical protein